MWGYCCFRRPWAAFTMLSVSQPFVARPFTHFSSHSSEGKSQSSRMIALVVSCCSFCCAFFCLNLKDMVFALWLGGSCWEDMAGVELGGSWGDDTAGVELGESWWEGADVEGKIGDGGWTVGEKNLGKYPPHVTGVLAAQIPSELSRIAMFSLECWSLPGMSSVISSSL